MSITYTEKGIWLHEEISNQGHSLIESDGIWISSNDIAVQAIIDSFDPLPIAKDTKRKELKVEAATRANSIYSFITPGNEDIDASDAQSFYDFAEDLYLSISPGSREALSGRLLQFKNLRDAAAAAVVSINALTDWQVVMAYDVVNDPTWP
jgi:hypothetical protein